METIEKNCSLLFDEMDIEQQVELCKLMGKILGFENMEEVGKRNLLRLEITSYILFY